MDKELIIGQIIHYIYTSPDSLYKVCKLKTTDDDTLLIVGDFPRLEDGLNYEFVGSLKEHPKYGLQFFVESYAKSNSFTKDGLINYLSSEKFYGIGPKLASNIVEELGLDCIEQILKDSNVLDHVYGITKGKKEAILETLKNNYAEEQVYIRLYGFGLTSKMVHKLYEIYGTKAANVIEENPYGLITDVDGFGFKKSDGLALNLGFAVNDIRRVKASIIYTLTTVCYQQGFTFLTYDQLFNSAIRLLDNHPLISESDWKEAYDTLIKEEKLIVEENRIFEPILYKSEIRCSEKIKKMNTVVGKKLSPDKISKTIDYIEENLQIKYTPLQREAILSSLSNKLSIITGGPGTGKSTILNGILKAYAELNNAALTDDEMQQKILMVAPTGRAAKRMHDTTHFKASTIHKALGYNFDGNFTFNENFLLSCSLVIVDEASMLDIELASKLFSALPNSCSVILVGDSNQLPSVGPGNVLQDLIATSLFKTTRLTQVMRQASGSNIIKLSHMILSEKISYNVFSEKKEVFFYPYETKEIIQGLFRILDNYVASGGNMITDMQILVPMYAGPAGIDAINSAVQERYNPEKEKTITRNFSTFKKNDKVLQLKNDSELDIMNGDIGKIIDITKIDEKDALLIDFDGRVVTYYAKNLDNLKLAYAISIHKSQGSEFNNVIMTVLPSYNIMLKKKIIYTGVTRAKSKLILLGRLESLEQAIHCADYVRQTYLYQRLEEKEVKIENRIFDSSIPFDTFGEYDMEGITPYSFM